MSEDERRSPPPAPKRKKTTPQTMDLDSEAFRTLLDEAVRRQLTTQATTTTPNSEAGTSSSSTGEFQISHVTAGLLVVFFCW